MTCRCNYLSQCWLNKIKDILSASIIIIFIHVYIKSASKRAYRVHGFTYMLLNSCCMDCVAITLLFNVFPDLIAHIQTLLAIGYAALEMASSSPSHIVCLLCNCMHVSRHTHRMASEVRYKWLPCTAWLVFCLCICIYDGACGRDDIAVFCHTSVLGQQRTSSRYWLPSCKFMWQWWFIRWPFRRGWDSLPGAPWSPTITNPASYYLSGIFMLAALCLAS